MMIISDQNGFLQYLVSTLKGRCRLLLAMDVGNTTISIGLFADELLIGTGSLQSAVARTADEYGLFIEHLLRRHQLTLSQIRGVAIASVVPPMTQTLIEMCREYWNLTPLVVGPGIRTGMSIRYKDPRELGADRIVNAVAAYHDCRSAVIVVDFGTATTLDIVSKEGLYVGGVIAPGVHISSEALFRHTAKLPRVDLVHTERVIGRDTETSIRSGILFGFASQVDGLVRKVWEELGYTGSVIATGGPANLIAPLSETIQKTEPHLALYGLCYIFRLNEPKLPKS